MNYSNTPNNIQKIDIVYTYVNNTDKKWLEKYKKYSSDINNGRFNFNGEIYFSLLSIQKFFNWVNNIYIIHDNQPFDLNFLDIDFRKKIIFIDHTDIIPSEYLPLFNSGAIECFIWKIKNLSDFFIYLNDDMFFGNYIYYSDFFTNNNQFKIFYETAEKTHLYKKSSYLISRYYAEKIFNTHFNTKIHLRNLHISFNLNKYICELCFNLFYNYLKRTFLIRIRKYDSYDISLNKVNYFSFLQLSSLMMYYCKIADTGTINRYVIQQLDNISYNKLIKMKPKIYCINQLYSNQSVLWNKLQNTYFTLFIDRYENFRNNLKIKIKELNKKLNKENKISKITPKK